MNEAGSSSMAIRNLGRTKKKGGPREGTALEVGLYKSGD